jgi:hypothetical protein
VIQPAEIDQVAEILVPLVRAFLAEPVRQAA